MTLAVNQNVVIARGMKPKGLLRPIHCFLKAADGHCAITTARSSPVADKNDASEYFDGRRFVDEGCELTSIASHLRLLLSGPSGPHRRAIKLNRRLRKLSISDGSQRANDLRAAA